MNQDITTIYIIIFSILVFITIFVFIKGYFKYKERRKEELINKIIYGNVDIKKFGSDYFNNTQNNNANHSMLYIITIIIINIIFLFCYLLFFNVNLTEHPLYCLGIFWFGISISYLPMEFNSPFDLYGTNIKFFILSLIVACVITPIIGAGGIGCGVLTFILAIPLIAEHEMHSPEAMWIMIGFYILCFYSSCVIAIINLLKKRVK
jgi:hypothetical protein